ncbi:MAG: hypothetical protein JW783_00460 [Bacteroidales bacterium]|jgi:hypothetical protein|nr:hypothetical protein [Bacteroidales bacterium]MBN2748493.1 hypothetical protein [Bacteroidales bacterium]
MYLVKVKVTAKSKANPNQKYKAKYLTGVYNPAGNGEKHELIEQHVKDFLNENLNPQDSDLSMTYRVTIQRKRIDFAVSKNK